MAETRTTPVIRCAGFTDAWEQRKLGEVAEFNPASTLPDRFEYVDLESVIGTELLSHRTESRESAPSRAQRLAAHGDIFFQTVRPYQRNNYIYELPAQDFVFSTGYAQMRPFYNGYFLFCRLQEERFLSEVLNRCTGTSYPAISSSDLADIEVMVPQDTAEQASIGNMFRNQDNLITLHQREYDKTVNIKKALLEKMFPKEGSDKPEIRFSGFTDAWEQRKLGELGIIVGGGTPSTNVPEYWDGDINWYAPAEIGEQIFVSSSARKITAAGLENSSARILPQGTVLFTSRAGIGKTAILQVEAATNQGFQSVQPNQNELDSYFIYSCSEKMKRYAETVGAGSTFIEVSGKQMEQMPILIPEIPEQRKIAEFFDNLDNLITLHQRELKKLQNMKKALLEKMFV